MEGVRRPRELQPGVPTNRLPPDARRAAIEILTRVEVEGSFSNVLLDQAARDPRWTPTGRALLHQFVKGTLTQRGAIDGVLNRLLERGIESVKPEVRNLIRLAAYQILHLDRAPKPKVVNESVILAKELAGEGVGRLVNAVLRQISRDAESGVSSASSSPQLSRAERYSHPEWVVALWEKSLGAQETEELLKANNQKWPTSIRVNTLRVTRAELVRALATDGVQVVQSPYLPDALRIHHLPRGRSFNRLQAYVDGLFHVQDESSMLIGELLDPRPGESILDLCSAPGGKTAYAAIMMRNRGRIVALDPHASRLRLVAEASSRLGVSIVRTKVGDGTNYVAPEKFDRVLVDAPCSGLGMLGRKADLRWSRGGDSVEALLVLQKKLLENGARLVRPGGRLVYSTCTINPRENEEVVLEFLARHRNFVVGDLPPVVPLARRVEEKFLQTLPHRHGIGGAFGVVLNRQP